jgi:S-adenosylmethionine synthetase
MMGKNRFLFTSESVTEGHPDKVCDQISDAVLDEVIKQDPAGRVACETFVTVGLVIVGGEITTHSYVDINNLTRNVLKDIGYTESRYGFNYKTCSVLNAIGSQSPDIAQGVDTGGAGDQGLMVGYAIDHTPELMPLPISLAHKLAMRLSDVRKKGILPYLGPDGKTQVTVEFQEGKPVRIDTVLISSQHTEEILDKSGSRITGEATDDIIKEVALPVIPGEMLDNGTRYLVNPTGKFVIGGPQSDTGMTGRKIIVDTYGGYTSHGGGAFSGKDPTKVDRSATYVARYIAKNLVASGLCKECTVQLAYAIGVPEPISVMVYTNGTDDIGESRLTELVRKHFDLTPRGIIEALELINPIYRKTSAYGHFGRELPEFTWEKTDMAEKLKKDA